MLLDTRFYRDVINKGNKVGLPEVGLLRVVCSLHFYVLHTLKPARDMSVSIGLRLTPLSSQVHTTSQPPACKWYGDALSQLQSPQPEAAACSGWGISLQAAQRHPLVLQIELTLMAMPTSPVPLKSVRDQLGARLQASLREQWKSKRRIPDSDNKAMRALVNRFTGQQGCRLSAGCAWGPHTTLRAAQMQKAALWPVSQFSWAAGPLQVSEICVRGDLQSVSQWTVCSSGGLQSAVGCRPCSGACWCAACGVRAGSPVR